MVFGAGNWIIGGFCSALDNTAVSGDRAGFVKEGTKLAAEVGDPMDEEEA
jgi:hypothetical protein